MKRLVLDADDKRRIFEAFQVWRREDIKRPDLEEFVRPLGVAAVDAYVTFLHLDTLAALGAHAPLVWKGGTAIQTLLPAQVQRVSTDLDFNATIGNVEAIRDAIVSCNERLESNGHIVQVDDVPYGRFFEADHRPWHKTIEFRRILPTLFSETVDLRPNALGGSDETHVRAPGRLERVQINYNHADLPALRPERVEATFFTQPRFSPRQQVMAVRASIHDLTSDKVLATTRHDGFGRERFKDVYDLVTLRGTGSVDLGMVSEKLGRIVGRDRLKAIVDGSRQTLDMLSEESAAAHGFRAMVCIQGKNLIDDWSAQVESTADWLGDLV